MGGDERKIGRTEIVCISAAGQPDGSLHGRPYILIRDPAAAPNIQYISRTTHRTLEGVTMAAYLLAA